MTAPQAPPLLPQPISRSWRNLLLSAHIIASVGLLGTDAAVLALNIAGWRHADPRTICPAAHLIGAWLLLPLGTCVPARSMPRHGARSSGSGRMTAVR
jgi:hypothetical protein